MKKITQKGFAHLGLLLLLVVLVAAALIGYKVTKDRNNVATPVTAATSSAAQTIPVVKNTADLNTVESTLNNQNIDGNLNPDSLNQDVQSLL